MPVEDIRQQLDLPTRIVNDVLYQLVQAGQLIAVPLGDNERDMAFVPAHDIGSLTVCGVLESVERAGEIVFVMDATPQLTRVDQELERLKSAVRQTQGCVRLVDLLKD